MGDLELALLFVCLASAACVSARELAGSLDAGYQNLPVAPLQDSHPQLTRSLDAESVVWTHSAHDSFNGSTLVFTMVHRDSPLASLQHRTEYASQQELFKARLARDAARAEALSRRASMAAKGIEQTELVAEQSSTTLMREEEATSAAGFTSPMMSGLGQGSGEYFIRLGVGTPARLTYMVVDTGSDVMWLQCSPCVDCYTQTDPLFNPAFSSSYRRVSCASPMCGMLELHSCGRRSNACVYQVAYGDGSFTTGEFSMETLSFSGASMRDVALGCGHDNEGLFAGASGLFGLGGGPLSFPSQMGPQFSKIFSYCLVPRTNQHSYSTLIFGNAGVPKATVFTPLLRNPSLATFYYVSLTGISVGGSLLSIPASAFKMDSNGDGGVIVDSGTSVTRLVEVAYGPLRSAFRAATRSLPFSGGVSLFDTCYDLSLVGSARVPALVLHFQGGADVALPASNYLVPVDARGTYCLAFASTAGALSIIGNIQQQGFRVVFDGVSSRLGFAANQC